MADGSHIDFIQELGWVRGRVVRVSDFGSEGWWFEARLLGFWLIALDKLLTPMEFSVHQAV